MKVLKIFFLTIIFFIISGFAICGAYTVFNKPEKVIKEEVTKEKILIKADNDDFVVSGNALIINNNNSTYNLFFDEKFQIEIIKEDE